MNKFIWIGAQVSQKRLPNTIKTLIFTRINVYYLTVNLIMKSILPKHLRASVGIRFNQSSISKDMILRISENKSLRRPQIGVQKISQLSSSIIHFSGCPRKGKLN